jgi:hypothetical protein
VKGPERVLPKNSVFNGVLRSCSIGYRVAHFIRCGVETHYKPESRPRYSDVPQAINRLKWSTTNAVDTSK